MYILSHGLFCSITLPLYSKDVDQCVQVLPYSSCRKPVTSMHSIATFTRRRYKRTI
jgi:hypothetical protein